MRKGTSAATGIANRANALKSTGPVTGRGQSVSRLNAAKHWGRAEAIRPMLAGLGEEPEEFDRVRDALYGALAPRDEFEALLVDDMADLHWRVRRMVRAEAGAQARHRRQRETQEEQTDARLESGKFQDLERSTIHTVGFVGLQDSPVKFDRVLEILRTLSELVRHAGFPGEVAVYLKQLYGYNPSERAAKLMSLYDRCCQERDCGDAARMEANQAEFQKAVAGEIAWFEQRAARDLRARAELRIPIVEAELLNTEHDPAKLALYHERLEKVFAQKWRLLVEYRANKAAGEQTAESDPAPSQTELPSVPRPGFDAPSAKP
jgi:hypothetical protein